MRKRLRSRLVEDEPEEMPENDGATELLKEPEEPEPVQQVEEEEDPIRTASRGVRFHWKQISTKKHLFWNSQVGQQKKKKEKQPLLVVAQVGASQLGSKWPGFLFFFCPLQPQQV